jgi:hypothetical protein
MCRKADRDNAGKGWKTDTFHDMIVHEV